MEAFHKVTNTETSLPQYSQNVVETILVDETTPSIEKKEPPTPNEKAQKEKDDCIYKLSIKFLELKKLIYCCIGVSIADFILVPIFPKNFLNPANILSICVIVSSLLVSLRIFNKKLQTINKSVYKSVKKILYIITIIIIFFYIDMLYVILFKLLLNDDVTWDGDYIFLPIILAMIYAGVNFSFPVFVIYKISQIRKIIKEIGFLEGDNYSLASFVVTKTDSIIGLGLSNGIDETQRKETVNA